MNPFVFDRPLAAKEAIGREGEAAELLRAIEDGTNVTVAAPRRFGKTSLINSVLERADRELGIATATVDCYGVLNRQDFAIRLASGYRSLPGRLGRRVAKLSEEATVGLQVAGTGATVGRKRPPLGIEQPIIELLDLPLEVLKRTGRRTVVAFDEFQSLVDVEGLDGLIRSRIQHHGQTASYVFAGSEPSLLHSLFVDRSRPFYGQARPLALGRLPLDGAYAAILARFEATNRDVAPGVLADLVALGAGHPQRTMLLANRLWDATPARGEADERRWRTAVDVALGWVGTEFDVMWTALTANERRVLATLAAGASPLSVEGRRVGIRQPSTAQKSIASLLRRGLLEGRGSDVRIIDPLLALWIAELRGR